MSLDKTLIAYNQTLDAHTNLPVQNLGTGIYVKPHTQRNDVLATHSIVEQCTYERALELADAYRNICISWKWIPLDVTTPKEIASCSMSEPTSAPEPTTLERLLRKLRIR